MYTFKFNLFLIVPFVAYYYLVFIMIFFFNFRFLFPKYLLSEHFWTDDQLKEYWIEEKTKLFEHNIRVFE